MGILLTYRRVIRTKCAVIRTKCAVIRTKCAVIRTKCAVKEHFFISCFYNFFIVL